VDAKHPNLACVSCTFAIGTEAVVLSGTVPKCLQQIAADALAFAVRCQTRIDR